MASTCGDLEQEFSKEEIAKHNKEDDCWIIIDDKVYDVSPFVSQHPGGVGAITKNAGKDSSEGFHRVDRHTQIGKEDNTYSGAQLKMSSLLIGAVRNGERKFKKQ
jgi:cytochrome b involved in lipid metabolism